MNKLKTLAFLGSFFLVSNFAVADTIIKFGLGGVDGPDIVYNSGVLSTSNDGDASTLGDQNTSLEFVGFLDGMFSDILSGASLTLASVTAVGNAIVNGTLITQATTGGTFHVYDASNNLLLSGLLADGAIIGSTTSSTGSFLSTSVANFTGGSLLSVLSLSPAAFSISLTDVLSDLGSFMSVANGGLQNFTADATGQIEGSPIPEPASIALLLSGVLGGIAKRRKSA